MRQDFVDVIWDNHRLRGQEGKVICMKGGPWAGWPSVLDTARAQQPLHQASRIDAALPKRPDGYAVGPLREPLPGFIKEEGDVSPLWSFNP